MRVLKLNKLLLLLLSCAIAQSVQASEVVSPSVQQGYDLIVKRAYSKAIVVLSDAVRLNPGDASARRYLAVALNQTGNSAKAVQQMELVIRLEPGKASDCAMLGEMYLLCGESTRAIARYKEGISFSPDSAQCRSGLATAYVAAGDGVRAKATCLEGLKVCRDVVARKRFAQILAELDASKQTAAPDARG